MQTIINKIKSHTLGIVIFYCILAYIPVLNNNYYVPKVVILLSGLAVLAIIEGYTRLRRTNDKINITPKTLLFILFFISQVLALMFSKAPLISLFGFYKIEGQNFLFSASAIILFFLSRNINTDKLRSVFKYILASTTLSAIYYSYLFIRSYLTHTNIRPTGLEGHPIWSASIIGIGLLLIPQVNSFLKQKKFALPYKGFLVFVLYFVHVLALIAFDSTLVFAALFISILLIIFIRFQQKKMMIFLVVVLPVFLTSFFIFPQILKKEQFSIFKRQQEYRLITHMFTEEFKKNQYSAKRILFGWGQETSGFTLLSYKDQQSKEDKEWINNRAIIHNQLLELWWSSGLFGLITWMAILITAYRITIQNKDYFLMLLLTYGFVWQQFYILTPSFQIFIILLLTIIFSRSKEKIVLAIPLLKRSAVIGLTLLSTVSIFLAASTLIGEIMFVLEKYENAYKIQPWNEVFMQKKLDAYVFQLSLCQKGLIDCPNNTKQDITQHALTIVREKVRLNPINPDNWNDYSAALFQFYYAHQSTDKRLVTQAMDAANKAIRLYPNNNVYYDTRGALYLEKQLYKQAEADFTKSFTLNPKHLSTIKHLIELYKQTNNQSKKKDFEDYLNSFNIPSCIR